MLKKGTQVAWHRAAINGRKAVDEAGYITEPYETWAWIKLYNGIEYAVDYDEMEVRTWKYGTPEPPEPGPSQEAAPTSPDPGEEFSIRQRDRQSLERLRRIRQAEAHRTFRYRT